MGELEGRIKDFVRSRGVELVGVAGPERLNGPPSIDPSYTMPEARSIVSMALPMNVDAIYDFLAKKSQSAHNLDQLKKNQRLFRISKETAKYLRSLGYRAREVPSNTSYRRGFSRVFFSLNPSFSHRFGAIASGLGAQGWSGNVMTREHGAAVYLGTVVTDAVLESDPPLPPPLFHRRILLQVQAVRQGMPIGDVSGRRGGVRAAERGAPPAGKARQTGSVQH